MGSTCEPRIAILMTGDVVRNKTIRVKGKYFLDAIRDQLPIVDVYNTSLHGVSRFLNALQVFRPSYQFWRQRLHMNVPAFKKSSYRAAKYLKSLSEPIDVIYQDGVLFDAQWDHTDIPSIISTDYTARLSANQPEYGRSPFTPRELDEWIALEAQAMQKATHIFTWSEYVRRSVIRDYNISTDRVTAVGGGLNFSRLPKVQPRLHQDSPMALFIGLDFYRKGGDLVLRAFENVRKQLPNTRLTVITSSAIPSELPMDGVSVYPPVWNRDALNAFYQQADIFVLPSRLETWGDVFIEAMAFELPCIGVEGLPMEEIIRHQETGLLVHSEDVEEITNALSYLFKNPELRQQWGKAGRARIVEKYTWEKVVNRMAPIIRIVGLEKTSRPCSLKEDSSCEKS